MVTWEADLGVGSSVKFDFNQRFEVIEVADYLF